MQPSADRSIAGGEEGPRAAERPRPPLASLPPVELLWKALTDSIDCFVTVAGPDLRILYLNHVDVGFEQVEQVIGREILEFVAPESREMVRRILLEVFATGRAAFYDVNAVNAQGELTSYAVRASAVEQGGKPVAVVLTAMDARKLRETERALRADRQALRQFIRTQERERQMISYEIHDGLAQYLAGAMMQLETAGHEIRSLDFPGSRKALDAFDEGVRLVRAATAESRRLINGLRPPMLDELGIVEAIESLVAEAKADVPAVDYVGPAKLARLDANVETALFRIVQESLTNSRKHAKARSAKVVLERRGDDDIAAVVEDDGIGFDTANVPEGCFGLEGIRQRARLFGREATIDSGPGRGTRIEVVLPTFPALERPFVGKANGVAEPA